QFVGVGGKKDFRKVKARVVNYADKPVRVLEMNLVYLDGAGKKISEWPYIQNGAQGFGSRDSDILAAKSAATPLEMPAFFMPEPTKKVAITVRRVVFADATEWRPGR